MKKGKILFVDRNVKDSELERIIQKVKSSADEVEVASEGKEGFYSLSEATLILLKRGVKQVSAISLSLPQIEVPIYWSTY